MVIFRSRLFPIVVFALLVWGVGFYFFNRAVGASADLIYQPPALAPRKPVVLEEPRAHTVVESPLVVRGKARGTWYFEASFPVKLLDAAGNLLGQAPAQAQGEWMTPSFVPFNLSLTFAQPTTNRGTLVLQKDNPSGDPAKDDSVSIPIRFW